MSVIGGPCSVEGKEQILPFGRRSEGSGSMYLSGGAYKPRTSPYAFQGLGTEGIEAMVQENGTPDRIGDHEY